MEREALLNVIAVVASLVGLIVALVSWLRAPRPGLQLKVGKVLYDVDVDPKDEKSLRDFARALRLAVDQESDGSEESLGEAGERPAAAKP